MKASRRKMWMMAIAMLLSMTAVEAVAQPSIPRKSTTTPARKSSRTTYSGNTVWGTQYDWLSTRYATYSDIKYLDAGQVRVLKNSIYARHGRRFKDSRLRAYFNSQDWYSPWRDEVNGSEFNKFETYNITFLAKYDH